MVLNGWKIGFVFLLILSLGAIGYLFYDKYQTGRLTDELNEQLTQAKLEIGKAHTQVGSLKDALANVEKQLADEIKENGELVVAYGELEALYNASGGGSGNGNLPNPDPVVIDPHKLENNRWYLVTNEGELMQFPPAIPIIWEDMRISMKGFIYPPKGDQKWFEFGEEYSYQLHQKFSAQLLQTVAPSGAVNHYLNLWEIDDKGKKIGKMKVTKFEVTYSDPNKPKFYWWAPHLDIGLFAGTNFSLEFNAGGSLGLTVMGYGKTKNDLSWKALRLGADFSNSDFGISFAPVSWNAGEVLPLVSNVWLSPMFSLSTDLERTIAILLSVGL